MKKITVIALLLAAALGAQARNGSGKPAYKDAGRPVEERVSDLLSRMTLEEKVMQLNQYTLGRNDNANNVADPVDKIPADQEPPRSARSSTSTPRPDCATGFRKKPSSSRGSESPCCSATT